jgi:precorrin-2/cobalt-factor-2 C20-methyltransferase
MDLGSRSAKDVVYPLSSDRQVKADFWNRTAAYTVDRVHDGVRVAFVTIGDPLVYSTWQHLLRQVVRLDPGLDVRTVPGISSYSLAAALSAVSLAEADGELVVCPAGSEKLETYLRGSACTVVMKIGRRLPELTDLLARTGMVKHSVMVISAGTENQRIVRGGDLLSQPESAGRMAVLIVRPPGQHTGAARHHAEKHRKTPGERTGPESTGTR